MKIEEARKTMAEARDLYAAWNEALPPKKDVRRVAYEMYVLVRKAERLLQLGKEEGERERFQSVIDQVRGYSMARHSQRCSTP